MGLVGLCASCSQWNYCGVPKPSCPQCLGTGRIDGGDIEGVDPLVVLRAALMALDDGEDRQELLHLHLLGEPGTGSTTGSALNADPLAGRMAIGRMAGQLLRDLGLRETKERKTLSPAQRAERKRAKAAANERNRLFTEKVERDMAKRARERHEAEITQRAAMAVAEQHPETFETEKEAAEVYIALEANLPDPSYLVHRSSR